MNISHTAVSDASEVPQPTGQVDGSFTTEDEKTKKLSKAASASRLFKNLAKLPRRRGSVESKPIALATGNAVTV
jgi:hypothetical protein